jgi:hypothetical protein
MRAAWRIRYLPNTQQKREQAHKLCQYLRTVLDLGAQKTRLS